jgi:[ribosomal protein S18]-alanine N-acetyltransferase
MKDLGIRNMEEKDIKQVMQIERVSFSMPWSEISFYKELHKKRTILKVAAIHEEIVGYAVGEYVVDEGHILDLAVHPRYRLMHVATVLVEDIVREFDSVLCRFVYLEVRASNHAALRLYENMGFGVVGIRKWYYVAPKEDGLIMMREI